MKQRNQYLDILRGTALILMVFGHCLQYGNGTEFIKSGGFFYNRLFQLIYSFHMPLFMLLSGYLFFYTAEKYQKNGDFIKNRWQRICLPVIGWQTIHYLVVVIRMLKDQEEITSGLFLKYIGSWFTDIWFLPAILYCSMVVFIVKKYLKDSIMVYALGLVLTFIVPDSIVNLALYKYMYPFFVCGYLLCRYLEKVKQIICKVGLEYLFVGALVGFAFLFCFWDINSYIYITGYTLLWRENVFRQLAIDLYRLLIGFMGSAVVVFGVKLVYERKQSRQPVKFWGKIISEVGRNSLCIYILSSEMVHWFLEDYSDWFHFSYLGTMLETMILLSISYGAAVLISRIPILNGILLGGKQAA